MNNFILGLFVGALFIGMLLLWPTKDDGDGPGY